MSLVIPLLLLIATLAVAYVSRRPKATAKVVELDQPADSSREYEAQLEDLRARRDRTRRKLLLRGDVVELRDVNVICEKGHMHRFTRFNKAATAGPSHSSFDSRNLAHYDPSGNYAGPSLFGRPVGEGLGWISASFGCPTCDAQRFSFAKFEHNEYTTCGNHLVRKGHVECPLCAELARSSREEMLLLAKLHRSQFPQRKAS